MAILMERCTYCGSNHMKINYRLDGRVALACDDCGRWLKWVGAREIPVYERLIANNRKEETQDNAQYEQDNKFSNIEIKVFNKDTGLAQYKTLTTDEVQKLFDAIDINKCLL